MIEAKICNRDAQHFRLMLSLNTTTDWSQKVGKLRRGEPKLGYSFLRNVGPSQYRILKLLEFLNYIVERERMMPVFESSGFSRLLHSYSLCWSSS
jgi:hypothetical protein